MKKLILLFAVSALCFTCNPDKNKPQDSDYDFTFAFLTDIHLQPERGAIDGFRMAIDCVNTLNPDFVITGGDMIMDAMATTFERADSLFNLYIQMVYEFEMPVYNTVGNHELFGIHDNSGIDPAHPEYGKKMVETRLGQRYYSFDHKGWHFMILDGVEQGKGEWGNYIGLVDSAQLDWIRKDLSIVDPSTPIVLSTHIPLVTAMPQILNGPLHRDIYSSVVVNSRDVLLPFINHNLKLILQGHLHIVEEINIAQKTSFIIGGAVCGRWWNTPEDSNVQEGFVLVKVKDGDFSWEYIDYGWETLKQ